MSSANRRLFTSASFSLNPALVSLRLSNITASQGRVWRIGRVDAFCPKGHGFDSRSSCHVGTLGKFFTHSYLWRFGVKFRHSIRAVSGALLSSSRFEEAL